MAQLKDLAKLRSLHWRLLVALFVINVSVFSFGFDNSVYSTTQAMDSFQKQFGSYNHKTHKYSYSARNLALLNSLGLPAKVVGAFVGYLVAEKLGRRISYIAMQFVVITGISVSFTAKTYGQILAGRMIVQCMVGWDNFLAPMYIAEIVPPQVRGAMVVTYVFSHVFGSLICSLIANTTKTYPGNASWQDPLIACYAFPAFTLVFCWLIPESPRWLVRRGKKAAAVKWLTTLNGTPEGYDPEREATLLQAAIERDNELHGRWIDLVRGSNTRRTMIAILTGAFNQLTGQSFVSQYGTLFVKSFNRLDPFVYTVISNSIAVAGPIVVFSCVDRVGRRPIYLVAGTLMTALLLTIGGLGSTHVNGTRADGIIGCAAPYGFFYIMSFGSISAVTGAEVPHMRLRDKTSFVTYFVRFVCDFLVTYTYPYLFQKQHADLGAQVGFIYGAFGVLGIVWGYFCLPELTGRSLEEINEMFEERVPLRKFKSWVSSNPQSIGAMVTEMERHPEHAQDMGVLDSKAIEPQHVEMLSDKDRV
ncbi:Hexadecenal dehydrogenase [Knufia peltigerae]|uniref:Hexadecenal dehydrogenase n=1 Tax=Knufia peltigerae TaxID=1002370 RepID=A0AA38Y3M6_9EURO|nr:Hexadecenal dehydrogenase [Knufia peltigerae]